MKYLLILALFFANTAFARDVYVQGHVTKNGTYVAPHHRSSPDNNPNNNYGTQGNYNPYSGQSGTAPRQPTYLQPSYPQQPTNRGNSAICPYGQRC